MANTFKFGNGNWATKEDSVLAYNDENNNFKPLPFDFTRASTATYVDSDGLIKTAGNGEARIDYTDSTDGALLLEPARTNSLLQSNQFDTTWVIGASALDLTSGQSGVGGSNDAWLLKKNTTGSRYIQQQLSLSSATYSYSVYMKAESTNWAYFWSYDGSASVNAYIDLENGVVGDTSGSNLDDVLIESVGNGWYRVTLVYTQGTTLVRIYPAYSNGSVSTGTDDGIYIQNAQLEAASYATSYIPTSGSSVTRAAETCSQTPPSGIIGQTEGTMFVEYDQNIIGQSATRRIIALTDGSINNRIVLYVSSSNKIEFFVRNSIGQLFYDTSLNVNTKGNHKIAAAYKDGDYVVYLDGVEIISGAGSSGTIPACNRIDLGSQLGFSSLFEPINNSKLYNTRLTNAELQTLTT